MMKNVLENYAAISAGDMSQSSITSAVTSTKHLDTIGIQLSWTGSPVGTFDVQVSNDYSSGKNTQANTGTWSSLPITPKVAALGAADNAYIHIPQISAPHIRVVYTKTSGTGSLTARIVGKSI